MEIEPKKCELIRSVYLQEKENEVLIPIEKDGAERIYEICLLYTSRCV